MLGLMDFVVGIVDSLAYWRVGFGIALTGLACWLTVVLIPNDTAKLMLCLPLVLIGVFFSFRWQHRSE